MPNVDSPVDRAICTALGEMLRGESTRQGALEEIALGDLVAAAEIGGVSALLFAQTGCEALRDAARRRAQRGLALTREAAELLAAANRSGGEPSLLPYKGPVLAQRLYGNPALRPSRDLDLLVDPRRADEVADLLRGRGYVRDPEHDAGHHVGWKREDLGLVVELHHALVPASWPLDLPWESLWETAESVEFLGRSTHALDPRLELPILAVHAARHGWCRLLWLVDSARLAQIVDLRESLQCARKLGILRIVLAALEASRRLFDLTFDDLPHLDDRTKEIAARIVPLSLQGKRPRGAEYVRLQLAQRERFRDRLRYRLRLASIGLQSSKTRTLPLVERS